MGDEIADFEEAGREGSSEKGQVTRVRSGNEEAEVETLEFWSPGRSM